MSTVGNNIARLRKQLEWTQEELAFKMGYKSKSTINKIELGINDIPQSKIAQFAKVLGTTPSHLMGWDNSTENSEQYPSNITLFATKKVPLLGKIACGEPIFASEEYGEFVLTSDSIDADFCLRAVGDSMIGARIYDGDVVFIKKAPAVNNGEIAAILIGDEATLKRVYFYPDKDKLVLAAENPAYEPLVYIGAELIDVRILGKAVAFQSLVR